MTLSWVNSAGSVNCSPPSLERAILSGATTLPATPFSRSGADPLARKSTVRPMHMPPLPGGREHMAHRCAGAYYLQQPGRWTEF